MSPDRRQHRGAHPEDRRLFAPEMLPSLRNAVADVSWLLGRGYPTKASLKLSGDRYHLTERQRQAVARASCSDAQTERRLKTRLDLCALEGQNLVVDGFNLIITVEAALGGGVLVHCRDGCIRDLSSVHGSYRSVFETEKAIGLAGEALEALKAGSVRWLLDRPVSNSARLAARITSLASQRLWPWTVEVVFNPDAAIVSSNEIAITSDSTILDGVARWANLNHHLVNRYLANSWVVDLSA